MFNLHFGIEKWKLNKEFNIYVSSYGNIKDKSKKIIYPKAYNNYLYVIIKHNFIPVHRLVLETFNPNQENLTVDHIDHNTKNNKLSNLRWLSDEDNWADSQEAVESLKDIGVFEYLQGVREEPNFSNNKKKQLLKRIKRRNAKEYSFEISYNEKKKNKIVVDIDTATYIINMKIGLPHQQIKNYLENMIFNNDKTASKFGFNINVVKEF